MTIEAKNTFIILGPPDPSKTVMVQHSSTVVCTASQPHHILIEPRDQYHNVCSFPPGQADKDNYSISIVEVSVSI